MNSKRPWIIAGVTTFALAGFGAAAAVASDDNTVRDPHPSPVVHEYDTGAVQPQAGAFDNSPESGDSPAASAVDSAASVNPVPAPVPAPDSADSPDGKVAPAAVKKEAKVTKPQAPRKTAPADSADSGGSAD